MTHRTDPAGHNTAPMNAPANVFFPNASTREEEHSATQRQQQQQQHQQGQWPSLLNIREVITAFILETVSNTRPLRDKLNVVIVQLWQRYLELVYAYPVLTTFLSVLAFFSAGPIIVFACVTGASLGFLVGTAAVIIFIIQSIIVTIAGAILLVVLGFIFVVTAFTFFWVVAGFFAFKFARGLAISLHESQLQKQKQQQHQESSSSPPQGSGAHQGGEKLSHRGETTRPAFGEHALDSRDVLVPEI
ncbi:hypothetical protein BG004_007032 [Podila humilis]|nr:hypothetical protein BG004_007032 [Podila humilis]